MRMSAQRSARPALPRPRHAAPLQALRGLVAALAHPDPQGRRHHLRRRAQARERARACERLLTDHLLRPPRVRDHARVRRGHGLPEPRRQPDLPVCEQLLLEDRDPWPRDVPDREVARSRPPGSGAARRRVLPQRQRRASRQLDRPQHRRVPLALHRHEPPQRLSVVDRRHRGRLDDRCFAEVDPGRRRHPEPLRPRDDGADDLLRDEGRSEGLRGRRVHTRRRDSRQRPCPATREQPVDASRQRSDGAVSDRRLSLRGWPAVSCACALLAVSGLTAFVLLRKHEFRNIHGSSSVEFVTTQAKPARPAEGVAWPRYGFDLAGTRNAGYRLRPPFRRVWAFNNNATLLEFPPAVAYGKLFLPTWDGRFLALDARTGHLLWRHRSGGCGWGTPVVWRLLVINTFIGHECGSPIPGTDGEIVAY